MPTRRSATVHPLVVRVAHWVNAIALVCIIMSGWAIYDALPLFAFRFPAWATLGGWLGGAIAWHLATMWLLVGNGLVYLAYGLVSRRFRRKLLPLRPSGVLRDARRRAVPPGAPRRRVQRGAAPRLCRRADAGRAGVASGLAIWKPVQLHALTATFRGYELARRVHFIAMAGIVGFILVHIALVLLVPRTLPTMITGRAKLPVAPEEQSR
jgi:thiosulfate reductase cytochrome b subunit